MSTLQSSDDLNAEGFTPLVSIPALGLSLQVVVGLGIGILSTLAGAGFEFALLNAIANAPVDATILNWF